MNFEKISNLKRWNTQVMGDVRKSYYYRQIRDDLLVRGQVKSDILEKVEKVRTCCSMIELKEKALSDPSGDIDQVIQLAGANFCRQHLVCPICSARVQNKRRAGYVDSLQQLARKYPHCYMVTFTIKDDYDLGRNLQALQDALLNFRKMGQKRGGNRSGGEFSKVRGGIISREIKRGEKSELWHTHAHGLLFTDRKFDYRVYDPEKKKAIIKDAGGYATKQQLAAAAISTVEIEGEPVPVSKFTGEWFLATGGTSCNVSIQEVPGTPEKIAAAAQEIIKYGSKLNKNSPQDVIEILEHAYNRRSISTYGEIRKVDEYEPEQVDPAGIYFNATWNGREYDSIKDQDSPRLSAPLNDKKKRYLGMQARITGFYRQARKSICNEAAETMKKVSSINEAKRIYKNSIKNLWLSYHDLGKRIKPPDPWAVAEQLSFSLV